MRDVIEGQTELLKTMMEEERTSKEKAQRRFVAD